MVCIDGLDGCDLMNLTILPKWESSFDVSKITKIGKIWNGFDDGKWSIGRTLHRVQNTNI
jgi:hypothetical protein